MILQALDTIHVSSVSSDNITTGQTFEVDDQVGRSLIERGLAIVQRFGDACAHPLQPRPFDLPLLGAHPAQRLHQLVEPAQLAQSLDPDRLDPGQIVGAVQPRERVGDFLFGFAGGVAGHIGGSLAERRAKKKRQPREGAALFLSRVRRLRREARPWPA